MIKNINILTREDCTERNVNETNIEGMIVILSPKFFKPEYIDAKYQLVRATGGFGCNPNSSGNAIFVKELYEGGESYRIERYNQEILGIAKEETIKEWEKIYGTIGGNKND